jgi:3-dehydroquinate synthase
MNKVINTNLYKIQLTTNYYKALQEYLHAHSYNQVIYLTDTKINDLYGNIPMLNNAISIVITAGENNKNIETCTAIWQKLLNLKADKNTLIVNFGGGLVSDLGGFVASNYKRGIDFINIPTTLLACVDASIGGKTGVNLNNIKNAVGTFCNPKLVIIDTCFFATLPRQELLSGFGEVLKHGLIVNNAYFKKCSVIDLNNVYFDWYPIIYTSLKIKQNIVSLDFEEKNIRKALNAGHTIGHALEATYMQLNTAYTHGECVAAGLLLESFIAFNCALLSSRNYQIIFNTITNYYDVKTMLNTITNWDMFHDAILNDKKNTDGTINFSLITSIGKCCINCYPSKHFVDIAINHLLKD